MRDNWFLAIDTAGDGPAIDEHMRRLCGARPVRARFGFDLAGGRHLTVLGADAARAVETARHWIWIAGSRPPPDALHRALIAARSTGELRQACADVAGDGCSFLVVDKQAGDYCAITDLVNLAAILHGKIGPSRFLASDLALFPRDGLRLDLGSIASYIVNGNALNNHTNFQEITYLERAAVHTFREGAHAHESYWRFAPGQSRHHRWHAPAAAAQLWDLLTESIDRTTRGKRVLLSLSGGYDSSVLLGILGARLRHPEVVCFSYLYGPQKPRSDAAVAGAQAALYGYEHVAAGSYSDDVLRMLDTAARVGQGMRRPAHEAEAFPMLAARYPDTADTIMLFGDECFGLDSYRINGVDDILGAARLKAPALLSRLESLLGTESTARLRAAMEAEYDILRARARDFADPDDAKDFIYFDQHLPFSLVALRRLYCGHWFAVATPLISREILDFMAAVPVDYRVGKRLFKEMARRFLPEQFRIPRAVEGGSSPDFARDIAADCDRLAAAVAERGWKIGGLADAARLTDLLRQARREVETRTWQRGAKARVRNGLARRIKALLTISPRIEDRQHWWRRRLINQFAEMPDPAYLPVNILSLAAALADAPAERWTAWSRGVPITVGLASDEAAGPKGLPAAGQPEVIPASPAT